MVSYSVHGALDIDGSLKKLTLDFLNKLATNPASPGLHIEPIKNSIDSRVRTGRVNDQFRAVLFELHDEFDHHFVVVGVYPHDDAITKAGKIRLEVNSVNGITRLIEETTVPAQKDDQESRRKAEEAAKRAQEQLLDAVEVPTPVELPSPGEALTLAGHTPEVLEAELGIDPAATRIVLELASEDDIAAALPSSPTWEKDALIGLVAGLSIEDIRESLAIPAPSTKPDTRSEDTRLIAGLKTPAAQMDFAYLDTPNSNDLRRVIETEGFDSWRVYIDPSQRSLVTRNFSGSGRVFGGAGTGKTVVVVHRANRLVTSDGHLETDEKTPRVLLTTYTRGLADALKSSMNALNPTFPEAEKPGSPGLWISGIDALANKVVALANTAEREAATTAILGRAAGRITPFIGNGEQEFWIDAIISADPGDLSEEISNTEFLAQEFETVILARGITQEKDYLRAPRPGRGTPLNRVQRKKVWAIIQQFMTSCAREGKMSWPALSSIAANILEQRAAAGQGRLFDHVLIDEAQDFHAGHWLLLRAAVAEGPNDIFLAEDSHQRIYGQHHVLSRFGISTRGRASKRLTLNYRTTAENLSYALGMLTGEWTDAEGETDTIEHYRSARKGPKPHLYQFESETDEFEAIAELIKVWQDSTTDVRIGILARTRPLINRVVNALSEQGIDAVKTQNAELAAHETVSVMTMHGAKGMEFTHVILIGMGRDLIPLQYTMQGLGEAERNDAQQRERSLLYVAASRARDALVLTTHTEPSELLPRV